MNWKGKHSACASLRWVTGISPTDNWRSSPTSTELHSALFVRLSVKGIACMHRCGKNNSETYSGQPDEPTVKLMENSEVFEG